MISLLRTFAEKQRLQQALRSLARADLPRIALVKQDCNEDLYCCSPDVDTLSLLRSTLLRSGPISLFASFAARYLMVTPDDAPECGIWREKADALGWAPADWFWNFRTRIPGRDHGQAAFSQPADAIDWSAFDIVISIDVAVPARITRRYPTVVWAYFVREVKAPSYQQSLQAPLAGQDLFLSQNFAPRRSSAAQHVIDFPYHFQRSGVFHQLAGLPWDAERCGVFVEYHSAREATDAELKSLEAFGPVFARRASDDTFDGVERVPHRSMAEPDFSALTRAKYHVKWGGRSVLGTAKVEAVAAGCLALSDPDRDATAFLHTDRSLARGFDVLLRRLHALEESPVRYAEELARQRRLVDYLCFARPANDLFRAWRRIRDSRRARTLKRRMSLAS